MPVFDQICPRLSRPGFGGDWVVMTGPWPGSCGFHGLGKTLTPEREPAPSTSSTPES